MGIVSFVTETTKNRTGVSLPIKNLALAIGLGYFSTTAFAFGPGGNPEPNIPSGWSIAEKSAYTGGHYKNVQTFVNGEGDFVALVDFKGGARIQSLQQPSRETKNGHTLFWRKTVQDWWNTVPSNTSRVLVVNGTYFDHSKDPSTISYAVFQKGYRNVVDIKAADPTNPHTFRQLSISYQKTVLVTNPDSNGNITNKANSLFAIVGLHPDYAKGWWATGRTFVCALTYSPKYDPRNIGNVMLIYVGGKNQSNEYAMLRLSEWGCNKNTTVTLDGSGSSQLVTKGGRKIKGDQRAVAQAIAIFNDAN